MVLLFTSRRVIDSRGMSLHEIVLPETKPETEWVCGRALQKVSPTYAHAILQRLLIVALGAWADDGDHGRVGPEWRFRVAPPREIVRPLVPDVAFLSYDALPRETPFDDVQVRLPRRRLPSKSFQRAIGAPTSPTRSQPICRREAQWSSSSTRKKRSSLSAIAAARVCSSPAIRSSMHRCRGFRSTWARCSRG